MIDYMLMYPHTFLLNQSFNKAFNTTIYTKALYKVYLRINNKIFFWLFEKNY